MPATEAQRKARNRWNNENMAARYDRINILAIKGQKEIITAAAQRAGETISQYILNAVQSRIDSENTIEETQPTEPRE